MSAVMAGLQQAGKAGLSIESCRKVGNRPNKRVVTQALNRLIAAGQVKRRGAGKTLHYWEASQPDDWLDVEWERLAAEIAEVRKAAKLKSERECWERHRRAIGKIPLAEYRAMQHAKSSARKERLRAEAEQRAQEREAKREAKRAEKASLAEIAKAAAEVRRLDAEAKKATRHRPMMTLKRGDQALTNALAKRIRADGTRGPAEPAKPAATVDWSRAHVTVAPRTPGRWDVGAVTPLFSALRPGQYLSESA